MANVLTAAATAATVDADANVFVTITIVTIDSLSFHTTVSQSGTHANKVRQKRVITSFFLLISHARRVLGKV